MSEFNVDDVKKVAPSKGAGAGSARAERREEMRRKWLEKRKAQDDAEAADAPEPDPLEKLLDLALTPAYIAFGGAVIVYRKIRGLPPVTAEDYDDD